MGGEQPGVRSVLIPRLELERRRLVLWLPVLFGCGIALYFAPLDDPPQWLLAASAALALTLWLGAIRLEGARLALALALSTIAAGHAAGGMRAQLVAAPALPGPLTALVEGRLVSLSQSASGRPRLLLDRVTIYGLDDAATPARVRVTLRRLAGADGLQPGDWLSVLADLMPPGPPVSPGGFDFARLAWFERLGAIGTARGAVALIEAGRPDTTAEALGFRWARLRAGIAAALRAGMPGEAGAFAAAIVTGDRSALPPEAVGALRDANLAHLLAISGLHMAMVSGLVFSAVRLGLVLLPGAALSWPVKGLAAMAALLAALAYLLLSGASVATQRAFAMAAIALGGVLVDRPAVALRGLAVAALVILALAPESLLSVGFQMSFAATLALVAVYEAIRRRGWMPPVAGWGRRLGRATAALVLTSLVAGLATAPFAAYHFNRIAPFGLLANLAAVPVMGLIVAPMLVLAGVLMPVGLSGPPLVLAGHGIDWILAVARSVAALPGSVRPVPSPDGPVLPLLVFGGLWLCLWSGRWRLLGAGPLLVALALWSLGPATRPDLAIAPGATAVAVRGPQGLAPDHAFLGGYAVRSWLDREGDDASQAEAASRRGWLRDGAWQTAVLPVGAVIHLARGSRVALSDIRGRCTPDAVVIVPDRRVPPLGACVLVDRTVLAEGLALTGAVEAGGRLRLMTVGAGDRPWRRRSSAVSSFGSTRRDAPES